MRLTTEEITMRVQDWLAEAKAHSHITEPDAVTLATADAKGRPSARVVLLKGCDERGFVFYTNMESRKGAELRANPHAALLFYWMPLNRQLRVEGWVEHVASSEADAYFASRSRESQLGAWASMQSQKLESREALMARYAQYEQDFAGAAVPRPPHWSGFRLIADTLEFWSQGDHRLHTRELFKRDENSWRMALLNP